jgi:predicted regulator of Ras-like GTPase activity (Roadblock/LC7/MglB family)
LPSPPAWSGFKVSAPSEAARPKEPASTEAKPTPIRPAAKSKTQPRTGPTITLPLRAIFQNLPPFQLAGDPDDVPPDVTIDLPFSVIEPQLALGRVAVSPKQFEEALPDKYLRLFDPNEANTPVSLPLQDVLANLPGTLLRIRDDQEEVETGAVFETPFSKAADEDAKRLNVATGPVAKQNVDEPEAPAEVAPSEPASKIERTPLQKTLDTDADLDAKAIVAHASRLPGVKACAIMFADGLSLAGSLPFELGADGLCAMAPSLVKRLETQVAETKFGALHSVTLFCENAPVSFFMHDNICLTVVHEDGEISADVRERLSFTTREVAGMYPPPV